MEFDPPLIETRLVRRYKRFLADVELASGEIITVHCANPGSMLGLTDPGIRAWISDSNNPKRKLRYSLEMVEADNTLVGINTSHPNRLAREAIEAGRISELTGWETLRPEVIYGDRSRVDLLLETAEKPPVYVEVKNVHFRRLPQVFEFPDSVTARGAKHLYELAKQVEAGARAAMLYIVQRDDGDSLKIAADLDPTYATAFEYAMKHGVEAYALCCRITPVSIDAHRLIKVEM